MRNVKDKFDGGCDGRDVRNQKEKIKVRFYSLLCLAIQFTDLRMHKKKPTPNR